ncbi:MAG: Glucosyltransferase-like protein [Phylliscum demangeonii]|nr:MAG: Glucosyltransferase-like protein [Phylliscum demangeonii]
MAAGLFRWAVGLWGYSGYQSPPMHGDFEAQRHWMEVTTHLPISVWYFYDLEWWGLDYPPLTAYHSWLVGKCGSLIDPTWFELSKSRGLDDPDLKIFMRAAVLVSEFLIFVPALLSLKRQLGRFRSIDPWDALIAFVAVLFQPGIILVDHGHYQFNTVMLGFVVASLSAFYAGRYLWCSVFFVAALGFKQMALYYAPAVFASLLGVCLFPRLDLVRLVRIALVTVLSFGLLFAPLLLAGLKDGPVTGDSGKILEPPVPLLSASSPLIQHLRDPLAWYYPVLQQLFQSIHRIFPFARGIFEDKVANVWCVANVVVKLRQFPAALLQQASLAATLMAILPPCIVLFLRPRSNALLYGVAATAWGFFLCSFQVHEKSVLLPLLPMTLLLAQQDGLAPDIRAWVGLANMLGIWTMYPMLQRDELRVPYFVLAFLWSYVLGLPPTTLSAYAADQRTGPRQTVGPLVRALHLSLYMLMMVWHFLESMIPPPDSKPDLWPVLNAVAGAAGFGLCYGWCVWQSVKKSGLLDDVSAGPGKKSLVAASEGGKAAKGPVQVGRR